MDPDTINIIIGCAVIAAALAVVVGLTLWSRRQINWIARAKLDSAREIIKQRHER